MHVLAHSLDQFEFGPPLGFANLSMIPLLYRQGQEATYVTLDEALATGHFRITEVSEGGHVPELRVHNDLENAVLLLDGEELVGAKQNRVVNLTILVPARASLTIPVSCVEAGRWRHVSDDFAGSGRAQFAEGRARKTQQVSRSLAVGASARADQVDVWDRISQRVSLCGAKAPTSAMADVFEARRNQIEDYVAALRPVDRQAGAAFAIGGHLTGIEWFDAPATLHKLLPKIVRSYALDAAITPTPDAPTAAHPAGADTLRECIAHLGSHQPRAHQTVGLGEALRWETREMTAAALALDGRLIHFVAFPLEDEGQPSGRMRSATQRRRQHRTS